MIIIESLVEVLLNVFAFLVTGYISYKKATKVSHKSIKQAEINTHKYVDDEIEKKAMYGPLYVLCPNCGAKIMITKNNLHEEKENARR